MSKRFPRRNRNAETPEELERSLPPNDEVQIMKEVRPVLIGITLAVFLVILTGILWKSFHP